MIAVRFGRVSTSLGPMWVAESDAGVAAATRSNDPAELLAGIARRFGPAAIEPGEVDGSWVDVTDRRLPPVDLRGLSPFDVRVYRAVRAVPPGSTVTYGDVAAQIGSPGAARAVGGAMARCPLFPAVPCHRVVRASDGWSGWGGDPATKRRLLAAERRG
jgi:AraC family transcriptional regulator of adaptative response/methylated-DNA-[protein]-cysteine methyltransferase